MLRVRVLLFNIIAARRILFVPKFPKGQYTEPSNLLLCISLHESFDPEATHCKTDQVWPRADLAMIAKALISTIQEQMQRSDLTNISLSSFVKGFCISEPLIIERIWSGRKRTLLWLLGR